LSRVVFTRGRSLSFGPKVNLDLFWLKDRSLEESDDLPEPGVLTQEIADDLQTALEQFSAIAEKLKG
jgi:type I restriction enzyme M protein